MSPIYHFWNILFFFLARNMSLIFHSHSGTVPEKVILPPSPLDHLLLNLTHGEWWLGMRFLLLLSHAPAGWRRRAGSLLSCPPLALLSAQQTSGSLPRQIYMGHNLHHGTAPTSCLDFPGLWRSQAGCALAIDGVNSLAFLFSQILPRGQELTLAGLCSSSEIHTGLFPSL